MRRFVVLLAHCVALGALAGCEYAPLDLEENAPSIADAFVERDFVVSGTLFIRYRENNDGNVGDDLCIVEQEIEGWAADELNDAGCVGCERVYTIAGRVVDNDGCDFGGPAAIDIGFTPVDFITQYTDSDYILGMLADNNAEYYLNTTRNPREGTPWTPAMGVFETPPFAPDGNNPWDTCDFEQCAITWFRYASTDWYATWHMGLDFDE